MTLGSTPTPRRLAVSAHVARAPSAHTAARPVRKEISHD
jgi:hypothetical protein